MIKTSNKFERGFNAEGWENYIKNLFEPEKVKVDVPQINQNIQNVGVPQNPQLNARNLDIEPRILFDQKKYLAKTSKLSRFQPKDLLKGKANLKSKSDFEKSILKNLQDKYDKIGELIEQPRQFKPEDLIKAGIQTARGVIILQSPSLGNNPNSE